MTRLLAIFALFVILSSEAAPADSYDLTGGVFLVHAPPDLTYSLGSHTWCESMRLEDCANQVSRVDSGRAAVWFVVSAWSEEKTFNGVEFGLGDFDPRSFEFVADGICLDGALGIQVPSSEYWPGPDTGISLASTAEGTWSGSIVPICWFAGYSYADADLIPLAENPATDFAGWTAGNRVGVLPPYPADCLGALGLGSEGTRCCPKSDADESVAGQSLSTGSPTDCSFPCAVEIAESNRLEFRTPAFSIFFGPGDLITVDLRDGQFTLNDTLVCFSSRHPWLPRDVYTLSQRYGASPFVRERVGGRGDAKSWNAAVDAYLDEEESILAAATKAYDAALFSDREGALARALAVFEERKDVYAQASIRSQGPSDVTLALYPWSGSMETWHPHQKPSPGDRPEDIQRRACTMLKNLRSLARHVPGWPVEWTLERGRMKGGRHSDEGNRLR